MTRVRLKNFHLLTPALEVFTSSTVFSWKRYLAREEEPCRYSNIPVPLAGAEPEREWVQGALSHASLGKAAPGSLHDVTKA